MNIWRWEKAVHSMQLQNLCYILFPCVFLNEIFDLVFYRYTTSLSPRTSIPICLHILQFYSEARELTTRASLFLTFIDHSFNVRSILSFFPHLFILQHFESFCKASHSMSLLFFNILHNADCEMKNWKI
jgi:hypothetical protein